MKKSTLLSLLTTAAIITTTAGTYATWDVISANSETTVRFNQPVTVNIKDNLTLTTKHTLNGNEPSATGKVSFKVVHDPKIVDRLTIVPTFSTNGTKSKEVIDPEKFEIEITDTITRSNLSRSENYVFTDDTLNSTQYNITIKPKTPDVAGKDINVELTATLSKSSESSESSESTPTPPQAEEGTY